MSRGDNFRQHSSTYARLVANVVEEGECWLGTEASIANYGYRRVSMRVGGRHAKFLAHILMFCLMELRKLGIEEPTCEELYLAYLEFRCSGLEIDHECNNPACRYPGHLQPLTRIENEHLKHKRRAALPPRENTEPAPEEIEF